MRVLMHANHMAPKSNIRVLKNARVFENTLLIFRSSFFECAPWWLIKCLLFFLEIIISVFSIYVTYEDDVASGFSSEWVYLRLSYGVTLYVNSLVTSYVAKFYTAAYKEMIYHFNELDAYFNTSSTYRLKMKMLNRVMCTLYICISLVTLGTTTSFCMTLNKYRTKMIYFSAYLNDVMLILANQRFVAEFMTFLIFLFVLSHFISQINRIVEKEFEIVKNLAGSTQSESCENARFRIIDVIYHKEYETCRALKNNFGIQAFMALGTIIVFFVDLTYWGVVSVNLQKTFWNENWIFISIYVLYNVLSVALVSVLTQKIRNEKINIRVTLARLNYCLVSGGRSNRHIKDLVRVSSVYAAGPGRFVSLDLGMSLLPFVLSASITYIIVMLQFTHFV